MKLFTFENVYALCSSRNTRNGFAHDCTLYVDDFEVAETTETTLHYLNRTWERYTFQSVILAAITDRIEAIKYRLMNIFKENHGYVRMSAKRNKEFNEFLNSSDNGSFQELSKLKEAYTYFDKTI